MLTLTHGLDVGVVLGGAPGKLLSQRARQGGVRHTLVAVSQVAAHADHTRRYKGLMSARHTRIQGGLCQQDTRGYKGVNVSKTHEDTQGLMSAKHTRIQGG